MKISQIPVDDVNPDDIKIIIKDSLFASVSFLKLWQKVGGNPYYIFVENENTLVALLPLVSFGKGFLKRIQSMPEGLYTRIFFNERVNIDRDKTAVFIKEHLEKTSFCKLFINDFYKSMTAFGDFNKLECSTNIVDISGEEYRPPDKKIQSEIRKASREQVNFEKFNLDKHFEPFMYLMEKTEKRHGRKARYPSRFFEELANLTVTDDRILWYYCHHESEPVSSHINFIEGDMIINWQVYFNKAFSYLKANQKILYDTALEASRRGLKYLNLGASPADAAGLLNYKEKWGGETYKYNCYYKKSFLGKLF